MGFPSFDEQFIAAQKIAHNLKEHRVVVTRHSNLSAAAHCIFHLFVGKLHAEKTIGSRHPTLLALRTVIRECAQVSSDSPFPLLAAKNHSRENSWSCDIELRNNSDSFLVCFSVRLISARLRSTLIEKYWKLFSIRSC